MKIIDHNWKWAHPLSAQTQPVKYLIIHHEGGDASVESVHAYHVSLGWAGIGYNYVVDLDGTIHAGRPEWATGAHCYGFNSCSIGVSFQGDYEHRETMPAAQLKAGRALIAMLEEEYRGAAIRGHGTMPGNATDCPGKYFPMKALLANPAATVAVAKRPELKRRLKAYALAHDVRIPEAFALNRNWGESARTLAWRVSRRLEGVRQTALPTVELYAALPNG